MADDRNQSASDKDPEAEGFTFVDKRRAAEPEAGQESEPSESDVVADDLDDADAPDTTYQIALYALGLLQMNAIQQLGLIADPKTGKANRDLGQARVAIDCVASLAAVLDAPDSALDSALRQNVRRVLTDLRLNYVTQTKMAAGEIKQD
jgi:hypothetical protein